MKLNYACAASALLALSAASMPAMAVDIYSFVLSGPAEAPPNASTGIGVAVVTIDSVLQTMRLQTTFTALVGNVTASHIHCCTAVAGAGTAGVATTTPTFAGFPLGANFGSYDQTFNMTLSSSYNPAYITANGGTTATAFAALTSGIAAGKAYLNIHTTAFPGGEIRGFLASPVPEPATYALMVGGLAAMGALVRRRRQA